METTVASSMDPINSIRSIKNWGAARTKSRQEKALVRFLNSRAVATFLPTVSVRHVYGGGKIRTFHRPLFSGYVFYDTQAIPASSVYESKRVAQLLSPPDPEQLQSELANLALAINAGGDLRETRLGQSGRPVRVKAGEMKGLCGELVRYGAASRLIIRVNFLSRCAELSIDEAFIEPI